LAIKQIKMSLLKVTAISRDGQAFAKSILFDTNDVVEPIIENVLGQSLIKIREGSSYRRDQNVDIRTYVVSEDLATIIALSTDEIFIGTIEQRNGESFPAPQAIFVKNRVVGIMEEVEENKSEFRYEGISQVSPDLYRISENLDTIKD